MPFYNPNASLNGLYPTGAFPGMSSDMYLPAMTPQAQYAMASFWDTVNNAQLSPELTRQLNQTSGTNTATASASGTPSSITPAATATNTAGIPGLGGNDISSKVETLIAKYPTMPQEIKNELRAAAQNGQIKEGDLATIETQIIGQTECTDGKDDGTISFGEKASAVGKGVWDSTIGAVIEHPVAAGAMIAGAAAVCTLFPPAAPVLLAVGAITGGYKLIKGIFKASSAKTDKEAKEAWKNIGGGGAETALSVVGLRGLKAAASTKAATDAANAGKSLSWKEFGQGVLEQIKNPKETMEPAVTRFNQGRENGGFWAGVKEFFGFKTKPADVSRSAEAACAEIQKNPRYIQDGGVRPGDTLTKSMPSNSKFTGNNIADAQKSFADFELALKESEHYPKIKGNLEECQRLLGEYIKADASEKTAICDSLDAEITKITGAVGTDTEIAGLKIGEYLNRNYKPSVQNGTATFTKGGKGWFLEQEKARTEALTKIEEQLRQMELNSSSKSRKTKNKKSKKSTKLKEEQVQGIMAKIKQNIAEGKEPYAVGDTDGAYKTALEQLNSSNDSTITGAKTLLEQKTSLTGEEYAKYKTEYADTTAYNKKIETVREAWDKYYTERSKFEQITGDKLPKEVKKYNKAVDSFNKAKGKVFDDNGKFKTTATEQEMKAMADARKQVETEKAKLPKEYQKQLQQSESATNQTVTQAEQKLAQAKKAHKWWNFWDKDLRNAKKQLTAAKAYAKLQADEATLTWGKAFSTIRNGVIAEDVANNIFG